MTRNVTTSIRQRLLNYARAEGRPFNEVLQYFALERFLYRLGCSPYRKAVIQEICQEPAPEDGLRFAAESVTGERIIEMAQYEGVRVRFTAYLGTARVSRAFQAWWSGFWPGISLCGRRRRRGCVASVIFECIANAN